MLSTRPGLVGQFLLSVCTLGVLTQRPAHAAVETDPQWVSVRSWQSCRVYSRLFKCTSTTLDRQHRITCNVGEGWVAVGGGAWADYGAGQGAMLVSSGLSDTTNLTGWFAASKDLALGDPVATNPHRLHVYVLGLSVVGLTREQVRGSIQVAHGNSQTVPHPSATATLSSAFLTISGGAIMSWFGSEPGNFLTQTFGGSGSWTGAGKDHGQPSNTSIFAHAVGVFSSIGHVPVAVEEFTSAAATQGGPLEVSVTPTRGVPVGLGAITTYGGAGRMLYRLGADASGGTFVAGSKDHFWSDAGALGLKVLTLRDNSPTPVRCPGPPF